LPLAFTSTGDATLALLAGPQILAARFAELGGAQVVNALVLKSRVSRLFTLPVRRLWIIRNFCWRYGMG